MKTYHSNSRYESNLKQADRGEDTEKKNENNSEEDDGSSQADPDTFSDDGYKID